jgi:adenylosuccinate lyase
MNTALTPLDGRYASRIQDLLPYLSEDALAKHRVIVEIRWLQHICETINKPISKRIDSLLDTTIKDFSSDDAVAIQSIEADVKHDVKAVEIWLGDLLKANGANELVPLVHFGRTSEDINNLSYALMIKTARDEVMVPAMLSIRDQLAQLSDATAEYPMLSRTHGQPATPTTLGKEINVFGYRLTNQISHIASVVVLGKCNGATGTYAADLVAFSDIDWQRVMKEFVETLGLSFNPLTTQIEPHDWIARLCNELSLANTILIDLSRDFWQYISMGYLKQAVVSGEVGSSTMPHKVNPIDFENAEANFGVSSALLRHLAEKLPISRLQRDLSDSSALRSISEALGHQLLALKSLGKGLSKVSGNQQAMLDDLSNEWVVLTEAVQTVMRKHGITDAYDQMKALSRGKELDHTTIRAIITALNIPQDDKKRLLALTPELYIGDAVILAGLR